MAWLVALGLAGTLIQAAAGAGPATVSGRVLEQGTHTPIAGAQVMLMVQLSGPPQGPIGPPPTATTDESGRFVFAGLEPGRYRLNVQKTGFAASIGPAFGNAPPPLELKAGERRGGIELTLQRGGVITGRVVDQAGEPLVDARVMALRKLSLPPLPAGAPAAVAAARLADRLMPAGPGAQTNDLGEFRLHSLPPGEYYVAASPRMQFPGASSAVSTSSAATTMVTTYFPGTVDSAAAQPIAVGAGQTSGGVELRMIIATASGVSGVVVDEAGQPVANALVRLMPRNASGPATMMMQPPSRTKTDARGAFSISSVTNGAYTLIAVPPVVIATTGPQRGGGAGIGASSFSFAGGTMAGGMTTESSNGTTVQYRDDTGTQQAVDVNEASVTGLQILVRRPR